VWKNSIEKGSYKSKLVRVQRLINNKIAKAYRMVSNEALYIQTGMTPIAIKIEEATQFYQLTRGSTKEEAQTDRDMGVKHWHQPAETTIFLTEYNEETSTIQIFTDGSKSEQGVGAGIAIFESGNHIKSLKCRLNKRCTNNQVEQLAILRALEYTENIQRKTRPPLYTRTAE
jgi:hypothetical protein